MYRHRLLGLLFFSLLLVVVLTALVIRYAEPINDGDIWFHLAYGRYFLENHTLVPDHTVFSWTFSENSTIYCAWISEIVFYILYKAGDLNYLYLLRYSIIIFFMMMFLSFIKNTQTRFYPVSLLIFLSGILMSYAGLRIKPEIFSFLYMAILVWAWLKVKSGYEHGLPLVYLFPLVLWIWVNSHGGFIFGVIFLILVLAGEGLNWFMGTSECLDSRMRKHLFISISASFITLLITPYGGQYPAQLINQLVLQTGDLTRHIGTIAEYQSIFYSEASHLHFVYYLIISSVILFYLLIIQAMQRRIDWALLLINGSFLILYMKYLRATYFWAVIFMLTCSYLIGKISQVTAEDSQRKTHRLVFQGIIMTLVLFLSGQTLYETFCTPSVGFNSIYVSPRSEAEYIRTHFPSLRMGNDYYCGSYLLWSLWPSKKVFIDARYFPYSSWFSEYNVMETCQDKVICGSLLAKYNCDLWCLAYDTPLAQHLSTSPNWRLVSYGPSACIFISRKVAFLQGDHYVSESIDKVGIYQKYKIAKFSASVGDLDVAAAIVNTMEPFPFCPRQIQVAINAKFNVGNNLLAKENYYGAIQMYNDALILVQKNPLTRLLFGKDENNDMSLIHQNLGYSLMKVNRYGEALVEFNEATRLDPDLTEARQHSIFTKSQIAKIDETIINLQDAFQKYPKNRKILYSLTFYHAMKGDYNNALGFLVRIKDIDPKNPDVYYNIACIYARQKKSKEAVEYVERAIEKGFNNWELLKKDHDLDNIRNTQYFQDLLVTHGHE